MRLKSKVALVLALLTFLCVTSIAYFQFQFTARSYSQEIDSSLNSSASAFVERVNELNQLHIAQEQYKTRDTATKNSAPAKNDSGKATVGKAKSAVEEEALDNGLVTDNYSFIFEKNYAQVAIEVFNIDKSIIVAPTSGVVEINENMLKVFEDMRPKMLNLTMEGVHYRVLVKPFNNTQAGLFIRSYNEFDSFVSQNLKFSFFAILIIIFIALLLGFIIGGRITKNIEEVTRRSKIIATDSDYSIRFNSKVKGEAGELGNTLNFVLDNLNNSKEEQQRMIENANHELKTPLTSIITNLSMLKKIEKLDPADVKEIIDELNSEAKELTGIVNELIALSRGEQVEGKIVEIDVLSSLSTICERIGNRENREITITGEDFKINWTREDFDRVVNNLIENALKFDTSQRVLRILSLDRTVWVIDSGPGFTERDAHHAHERFYRGEQAQYVEGSGLGLSIVKSIVEKYKSSLLIDTDYKKGAKVGVKFN